MWIDGFNKIILISKNIETSLKFYKLALKPIFPMEKMNWVSLPGTLLYVSMMKIVIMVKRSYVLQHNTE